MSDVSDLLTLDAALECVQRCEITLRAIHVLTIGATPRRREIERSVDLFGDLRWLLIAARSYLATVERSQDTALRELAAEIRTLGMTFERIADVAIQTCNLAMTKFGVAVGDLVELRPRLAQQQP